MSILRRFKDIMDSNINALLDKCENPEKMVDQYLRNAKSDLAKVKSETAAVMAEEKRAVTTLKACADSIVRYESLAAQAVAAGNDEDALAFLEEQGKHEENMASLQSTCDLAVQNAQKMRQLYNKLVKDVQTLESKRNTLKAKISVAKTQETVNKIGANSAKYGASVSKYADLEARVDNRLNKALAEAELDEQSYGKISDLEAKYRTGSVASNDKLAALKAKMYGAPKDEGTNIDTVASKYSEIVESGD